MAQHPRHYQQALRRGLSLVGASTLLAIGVASPAAGQCAFESSSYQVNEFENSIELTVVRTDGQADPLACNIVDLGTGTASPGFDVGTDYPPFPGPFLVQWGDSDTAPKTVNLEIYDDSDPEGTETIDAGFGLPPAKLPPSAGRDGVVRVASAVTSSTTTITILDDDEPPTLRFGANIPTASEGSLASIQVTRSGGLGIAGADIAVAGGTAQELTDFAVQAFGSCDRDVCLESDSNATAFDVVIYFDLEAEGLESFTLRLENPTPGAEIGSPSTVQVVIFDAGVCGFATNPITVAEGAELLTIVVDRKGGAAGSLECLLETADGEPPGGATSPDDYEATSAQLSWGNGDDSSREVVVPIIQDAEQEGDEQFLALLSVTSVPMLRQPPQRLMQASEQEPLEVAPITILDDELSSLFSFDREGLDTSEAAGSVELLVRRRGDVAKEAAIDVLVIDDSAKEGLDFTLPNKTLTWGPGDDDPKPLRIDIVRDALTEPTEQAFFSLQNARETPAGGGQPATEEPFVVRLRIGNLPLQGELRFTSHLFGAFEGDPPLPAAATVAPNVRVVVERATSAQSAAAVRVCLGDDGTATPAEDFVLPADTLLTWGEGELGPKELRLEVLDDDDVEGTELVELRLCNAGGGAGLGEPAVAFLVIGDDDFEVSEPTEIAGPATGPENPIVVYDRFGRKVVVWQAEDGDGYGIFAQLYDDADQPLGPPFRVNAGAAGNQTEPSASFDDAGGFLVVYREEEGSFATTSSGRALARSAQGASVVARRFTPTGQPQGGGTVVTTGDAQSGQQPEVSLDKDGEATITWRDRGQPRGALLDRTDMPVTGDFDISDGADACGPEVAVAASGDFVVVWVEGDCDGEGTGRVRARQFDDRGDPKGAEITVATGLGIARAAVGMDEPGNFAVVWQALGVDGLDVFARLYDAQGRPFGPAFRVNQQTSGDQTHPRIDANSVFDLAVVWQSSPTGTGGGATAAGSSVVGRFFNPQGQAQSGDVVTATAPAGTDVANPDVSIENKDDVTVVWEKRGSGGEPTGIDSAVIKPSLLAGTCDPNEETLCLADERFEVTVEWQDFSGNGGAGQAVLLTGDTGFAWFFDAANVEIILKVLDGCAINGHYWVFAAGLSNVEVNLRVDDVVSGDTATYFNSLGQSFQPILDTTAFATCALDTQQPSSPEGAFSSLARELESITAAVARLRGAHAPAGRTGSRAAACASGSTSLCLADSRFEVAVDWRSADAAGEGNAVPLTTDSGYFWFFDDDNVEAIVKVLDACVINGHYWVFAAGLTDVETLLTVTDTELPRSRGYQSELGVPFPPVLDVEAFECASNP
jgi:hypothetical protein